MNLVAARLTENGARLARATIPLSREVMARAANRGLNSVTLGFRPEDVNLTTGDTGIPIQIEIVEELGPDA